MHKGGSESIQKSTKHLTETLSEDFAVHLGESKVINMDEKKFTSKNVFSQLKISFWRWIRSI